MTGRLVFSVPNLQKTWALTSHEHLGPHGRIAKNGRGGGLSSLVRCDGILVAILFSQHESLLIL